MDDDAGPTPQLKVWINGLPTEDARVDFARRCNTTIKHLRNVAYFKKCSAELAARVDAESNGAVRRWHLRPRDWHQIWPELIGAEGAPSVQAAQPAIQEAA